MSPKQLFTIAFCSILSITGSVFAQQTPTSLIGRIFSPYGSVRTATITIDLNSKKSKYRKTTASDDSGAYLFQGIPTGSYRVFVTDSNGLTYENPAFDVPADRTARLDVEIDYGGDCANYAGDPLVLSEKDKAAIFNETLRDVLQKPRIILSEQLLRQQAGIILATENINPAWLKPLKNIKPILLSSDEISKKAAADGDFLHLTFGNFKIRGDCVVAAISNMWAININSRAVPVSGGGKVFVYRKKGGKFKLKTTGLWNF